MRVLACSITVSRFRMSSVNGDLGIKTPSGLLIRAIQPAPRRLTWTVKPLYSISSSRVIIGNAACLNLFSNYTGNQVPGR